MAINTTVENINNQPTIQPRTVTGIFTKYIAKTLPLAFDESMSYYECLCALLKYLNETIVPDINNTNDGLSELQGFYLDLQNYVNTYFDNLDVQDEINNKLDDMVEDGTLQEIITNYLNSKAIFVYNNVSEMKLSTNLINGSYAQTLGYYTNNDCGGSLYKIRTITNDDVVDEMLIIAMSDNTLVAELQYSDNIHIKQLGAIGDGETDDSSKIITALSKVDKVIIDAGDYKIEQDINIPRNNITIEGVSFRNSSLIFENGNSLNFIGTSILNGGTHKDFLTLNNLKFTTPNIHIDSVEPFIQLINCSYVKIQNCWITNKGKQILMWECFDSRILNTDFEWGGSSSSATSFGLELRSENGGNDQLPTYEYTNNIYFQGCRFESHIGSCIGTTGNHSNKITFESCKFESFNCLNQRALNITHAETIYFTNCVFAGDIGNTKNYVYIDSVTDFTITGYGEHASHNNLSYTGEPLFYVSGSGNRKIDIQLNNNNVYAIDQKTFGLDSWDNNIFINGDIHVNNFRNDNLLITTRRTGIATLTNGDTTLDYTCTDNGWIYVSMVGTTGGTSVQRLALKDNTANYELRLITIADRYVTGFMPVTKGDNITCISNDTATAYVTFLPNRGYPSN